MANLSNLKKLQGRSSHDNFKRIGHNTKACAYFNGSFAIKYHSTTVIDFEAATRTLVVQTNGWFSVTTLQRIRFGLDYLGLSLSTSDLKGKWRVMDNHGNAFTLRGNSIKLRQTNGEWARVY